MQIKKSVRKDATVTYMANGNVDVNPKEWDGIRVINTKHVRKGRLTLMPDGKAQFHAYSNEGRPRYRMLTTTEHGEVKRTRKDVKVCLSFPRRLGAEAIGQLMAEEVANLLAWVTLHNTLIEKGGKVC